LPDAEKFCGEVSLLNLPSHHSITSSARASRLSGTVRASAFAVLRLMTSSYLVGACTGRSAGFSPLRMRSTEPAACRYWLSRSDPYEIRQRHRTEIAANWATPVDKEASRRTATVTLSRNYIHRNMARRTRIEYSATHMMSEAQPRLSPTACSLMVNSPWRSNQWAPRPRTVSLPPN